MRALAGLVAAFLLTGNVLAAAGLCVIKAPGALHAAMSEAMTEASPDASDCSQHHADNTAPASNVHHCPTDDPSAQTRTVDVPAAQLIAAQAPNLINWHDAMLRRETLVVVDHPAEPQRLYARLQRLRL